MTACEPCWNEAFRQSRMLGGSQVDYYLRLIETLDNHPHSDTPTTPAPKRGVMPDHTAGCLRRNRVDPPHMDARHSTCPCVCHEGAGTPVVRAKRVRLTRLDADGRPAGEPVVFDGPLWSVEWESALFVDPDLKVRAVLPLHRTEAGWPRCSTGGCYDCTDPA